MVQLSHDLTNSVSNITPPPPWSHPWLCLCSLRISHLLRILVTSMDFILLGVVCNTFVDNAKAL